MSNKFQNKYCDGNAVDIYVDGKQRGSVPVIFIFGVNGWVSSSTNRIIELAVNTAAKFNDHVILLLFGQKSALNIKVQSNVEIIEIFNAKDPVHKAFVEFNVPIYKHLSPNGVNYELFCFRRWFGMLAFMELRGYEHAFVADNDVLLLSNVTRDAQRCYVGCKTFGNLVYSVYMRIDLLRDFIAFLRNLYREDNRIQLNDYYKHWGVVSDMTMFVSFSQSNSIGECCTSKMTPLKSELKHRAPFDGTFYEYDYFQDERLQLPFMTRGDENKAPHMFQNLHFQGFRKSSLSRCPEMGI